MPRTDATLTITIEHDPATASRTLVIRCAHAITTLPLPATADTAAERTGRTLAILKHYSITTCACGPATRPPRRSDTNG